MSSDAIHEYLAASKQAALQTAGGVEALQAAVHQRWSVKTAADPGAQKLVGQAPTPTTIANMRALTVPAVLPPDGRSPGTEETVWQLEATLTGYKKESDGDYHLVIADAQGATMIAEIPDPAALAPGSFFAPQIAAARQAFDGHFGIQASPAPAGGPAPAAPAAPAAATVAEAAFPAAEAAAADVAAADVAAADVAAADVAAADVAAPELAGVSSLVQVSEPVTLQGLGFFDFAHGQDGVAPNAIELHPVISIVFGGQAPAAAAAQA
jgi:hypothetical protein